MVVSRDKDLPLKEDIRLLGRMLGDTLRAQEGEKMYQVVETIRQHARKRFRQRFARSRDPGFLPGQLSPSPETNRRARFHAVMRSGIRY